MDAAAVLPLALVVVAGPQIVCSFFFATSENWKGTSAAYVFGGAIAVTAVYTAAYFVAKAAKVGASKSSSSSHVLDYIVMAVLLILVVYVFLTRKHAERPKFMGRLETATARFAYLLGLVLVGLFPTGLLSEVAAGVHLASHKAPWADGIPFIVLTIVLLATPAILVVLLGHRAQEWLPKARHWMNTHSWVVSEIVLVFLLVIEVHSVTG